MDSALAAKENTSIILMKKNANNIEMNKISAPLSSPIHHLCRVELCGFWYFIRTTTTLNYMVTYSKRLPYI